MDKVISLLNERLKNFEGDNFLDLQEQFKHSNVDLFLAVQLCDKPVIHSDRGEHYRCSCWLDYYQHVGTYKGHVRQRMLVE